MFCVFASWLNIKRHLHLFFGVVNYLQSPETEEKHKTQIVTSLFCEHPTCLWFWSTLEIRLFLIQRTSWLMWVSKVPWGITLVPWLLPSSSSIFYVTKMMGRCLGMRLWKMSLPWSTKQKCKGLLYNAYIFMILVSTCLTFSNTMETRMLRNRP